MSSSPSISNITNTVAVYWDFENLHAALFERDWAGAKSYYDTRYTQQDALVNVKAVMDYAAGIGDVAIARAYNNWQWYSRYRDALNSAGLDLVQMYPKGMRAKNGADIRLALDALEDVFRYPKLTHAVIVSSDSDFVPLAQKLKQAGLTVIGIGVPQATNVYWARVCDEFRDYDTLLGLASDIGRSISTDEKEEDEEVPLKPMSLDEAKQLMVDALRQLVAQRGVEELPRATLKGMMKRMNATFDEANLGFLTFSSFVKSFPDVVEDLPDDSGGRVRLLTESERLGAASHPAPPPPTAEQDYELILNRGNVRLLPYPWWREAVKVVGDIFRAAPRGELTSFDDLEGELSAHLETAGLDGDPEMAHKLRGFLFSLWQFDLDRERQLIRLKSPNEPLLRCVEKEIVRRIVRFAAPPVDVSKVAAILHGEEEAPKHLDEARELIKRVGGSPG